jgi:hypothetical protein
MTSWRWGPEPFHPAPQATVEGNPRAGPAVRVPSYPAAPVQARPVRLSFSLFSVSFSLSSLPRWPKWIPPLNDLASPSTTTSLCSSPLVDPALEVPKGRVPAAMRALGARAGVGLCPLVSYESEPPLALADPPLSDWAGVDTPVGAGASWTREDLRPGGKGHCFLIAARPGEGALPARVPILSGTSPSDPFPGSQCGAPRPLPEPPCLSSFLDTPPGAPPKVWL